MEDKLTINGTIISAFFSDDLNDVEITVIYKGDESKIKTKTYKNVLYNGKDYVLNDLIIELHEKREN